MSGKNESNPSIAKDKIKTSRDIKPKYYKKIYLIFFILLITFVSFFGYKYWESNYTITPDKEKLVLEEAKQLILKDDVKGAEDKYDYIVIQAETCMGQLKINCSISAWEKMEKYYKPSPNYSYYLSLGALYRLNKEEIKMKDAYKKAYEIMSKSNNLNDQDKNKLLELKEYFDENN